MGKNQDIIGKNLTPNFRREIEGLIEKNGQEGGKVANFAGK